MTSPLIAGSGRVSSAGLLALGPKPLRRTFAELEAGEPDSFGLPRLRHRWFTDRPAPHFGRMDILCKLALGAAELCLAAADAELPRDETAVVGATRLGCLEADARFHDTLLKGGYAGASPGLFVYTLPSMFVGEVAIRFQLRGRCTLLCNGAQSAGAALSRALRLVETGRAPAALAIYADAAGPAARALKDGPGQSLAAAWLVLGQGTGHPMTRRELPHAADNSAFVEALEQRLSRP